MTAPTTRDAKLARLRQHITNLKLRPGHHVQFGTPSVSQISNYWNRDLAADLEALLSEIAALRGGLEASREEADRLAYGCDDARLAAVEIRATQAERQRDEAVGLLRRWTQLDGQWSANIDTGAFLGRIANQGADQ